MHMHCKCYANALLEKERKKKGKKKKNSLLRECAKAHSPRKLRFREGSTPKKSFEKKISFLKGFDPKVDTRATI